MPDHSLSAAAEAEYLHRCMFSMPLDPGIVAQYDAASRCVFADQSPSQLIVRITLRRLDAEAIEYALRRRGRGQELTTRMQVLCYLVEVRDSYESEFINMEPDRLRAAGAIIAGAARTAWKFVKGEYLIRRHGLL